jgi:hypothetical protein
VTLDKAFVCMDTALCDQIYMTTAYNKLNPTALE